MKKPGQKQLYKCTEIVKISRHGTFPDESTYTNIQPATGTMGEYLRPAAIFLAKAMASDEEFIKNYKPEEK